ncbi:hypothetical protein OF83DRAFT_1152991 [Amylostereum chailletii]|nr:hypothetical protein OF83DRAFT_1152991 [Amylostereum chailletii]
MSSYPPSRNTTLAPDPYQKLNVNEVEWRDRQQFLALRGYMLRPRLRPGWKPSWVANGKLYLSCEDHIALPARLNLVDATRISDGKLVYIKRVSTGNQESTVATMLSASDLRDDPNNHSVPILETFSDDQDPSISYMVMPFLRRITGPAFSTVGEVIDFVDQVLAGLVFMHEHHVAHRDCSEPNLMMDASAMYPLGFHPVYDRYLPDGRTPASRTMLPRSAAGVKYYFVDYGISSSYIPPEQPIKLVTGLPGRDRDVPELSDTIPYDPFKVDIFTIGNVLRTEFQEVYSNVDFLKPVINSMMKPTPSERPTAAEALAQWRDVRRRASALGKSWRLRGRQENIISRTVWDTVHVFSSASQLTKWAFNKKK